MWGRSSAGRASRSQCEGREFDPPRFHQDLLHYLEILKKRGSLVRGQNVTTSSRVAIYFGAVFSRGLVSQLSSRFLRLSLWCPCVLKAVAGLGQAFR